MEAEVFSEAALKTRYCAQMMAAASVLAGTAPDDFRRRVLARSIFLYCHEFIRWARRAKNELRGRPELRETVRTLERELNALEKRDWGSYEETRHHIAAHRQTLATNPAASILQGNELWTDISDATVRILSEDARAIWNRLAQVHGIPTLDTFPPLTPELQRGLADHGYEPGPPGLLSGVGSFDATREDTVLVMQGGELGEQNRQIVDALRNVRTLGQLWPAVNGHEPYWRVAIGATLIEACTLIDLTYGPEGGDSEYHQLSLLQLFERDEPGSGAIPVLRAERAALNPAALAHVRGLRNRGGAHVDDSMPLHEISEALKQFDPVALNAVIDNVLSALTAAVRAERLLRPLMMFDVTLKGFARAEPLREARPYDD